MGQNLDAFIAKWAAAGPSERANKDLFLAELCAVLDVPPPNPSANDPERDTYVFEREAKLAHEGGESTIGRIDLYKQDCFILEAKQASGEGSSKLGKAKRGTPAWNILMMEAYGQALGYALSFDRRPPFIIVCDIGHCFDLYAAFDGSGNYRPFPNAQNNRLFLADLGKHRETLRTLFEKPHDLDPSKHSAKITREVAGHLANLAKKLEDDGHDATLVAQFLMRCLFTMFAEDVGLLPEGMFTKALKEQWLPHPEIFPSQIEHVWRTMNEGGELFVIGRILRFNGGLFANPQALRLDKKALGLLLEAAECNWSDVEPAIFGTLLERALDPKERHALGAHYTPRAYVERLVRPTIEEPLRADWDVVQAQARRFVVAAEQAKTPKAHKDKLAEAVEVVRAFHSKLCHTHVLDPACGSGNFLYVTLDLFKRLEGEVLGLLESLGEKQTLMHMEKVRVTPAQFHGIEIKRWAKEIAELVLWIGYLQWHFRMYGKNSPVSEPVLQDYKNIECRDAVLAYDGEPELVRDEKGKPVTRWDGESTKTNSVTGNEVPDETKRVSVYKYKNPRKADWPKVDFIVGNPPFIGTKRMRSALTDEYVDALRTTYQAEVEDNADLVMYWWEKAAALLAKKAIQSFGFITTNSITMSFNRRLVRRHLESGVRLVWCVPDHPWSDSESGAAVRIAMTSASIDMDRRPVLMRVVTEETDPEAGDGSASITFSIQTGGVLHEDLRMGADVAGVGPLLANGGLGGMGVALHGHGFVLEPSQAIKLRGGLTDPTIRPYLGGRDLQQERRERYLIDFSGMTEEAARIVNPAAFQHVVDHVLPERVANRRDSIRTLWWRFGWERPLLREAMNGLPRFVATPETAKSRVFQFVDGAVLPDHKIVVVASDDASHLGVLSSRVHVTWALASGGRLEDRPVYNKSLCFDTFPFPLGGTNQLARIRELGEELDAHRKRQQAAHPDLTITGMYNVLEKLRSGEALTAKDKVIHEQGLVSVLKKAARRSGRGRLRCLRLAARPDRRTDPGTPGGAERRARGRGAARAHPLAAPRIPEPDRRQGRDPRKARHHRRARRSRTRCRHRDRLAQETGRTDRGRARPPDQGRGRVDRGRSRRRLQERQEIRRRRSPRQPRCPRHPGRLRSPRHPPLEIHPRGCVACDDLKRGNVVVGGVACYAS